MPGHELNVIPMFKARLCLDCVHCTKLLYAAPQCCIGAEKKLAPVKLEDVKDCPKWPTWFNILEEVWFSIEFKDQKVYNKHET